MTQSIQELILKERQGDWDAFKALVKMVENRHEEAISWAKNLTPDKNSVFNETYWYGSIHYWHAPLLDGCRIEDPEPTMCERCGYVSYDFKQATEIAPSFLQTESYKTCDGFKDKLDFDIFYTARYRYYILDRRCNNHKEMYYSLRQCMHLYGKKIHRELLPEVYKTFLLAMKENLGYSDSELLAIKSFYLRLMGKFNEAKALLSSRDYTNLRNYDDRRLLFEEEMINRKCRKVQDFEDYRQWEIPYLIDLYGDEFDKNMRIVVGSEVPLLYHDNIKGQKWLDVAYSYIDIMGLKADERVLYELLANQKRALYDMDDAGLNGEEIEVYQTLRFHYYKLLDEKAEILNKTII